jgi:phenylpropionate dioxygenase-like ring-hydroxylating dioxygenase large terminal subunit
MPLDPVIRDLWHVAFVGEELPAGASRSNMLFEQRLTVARATDGAPSVADEAGRPLPVLERYGFLWTSVGEPKPLFEIPEYDEPDRKNVCTGSVGIRVSAPRAIENFLDMGHFPFVHTGLLGEEPHTEVKEYTVAIDEAKDEVVATECRFWQPQAAAASTGGAEVAYVYRVPHPFCAVLYKTSAPDPNRFDVIALFVQPIGEERVIGHPMMSIIDDVSSVGAIRHFQLTIFGQDKPILENQRPRKLPLDPRAETPIRADKSSIAYRRWLTAKGLRYGVIPAAAGCPPRRSA